MRDFNLTEAQLTWEKTPIAFFEFNVCEREHKLRCEVSVNVQVKY